MATDINQIVLWSVNSMTLLTTGWIKMFDNETWFIAYIAVS